MSNNNDHRYTRDDLISRFDNILKKTFAEIDDLGILHQVQAHDLQKGIAGTIIEQCVLRYPPDSEQRPDLIVLDDGNQIPTELKTTGIKKSDGDGCPYIAKEPMSITAVGVYDIGEQTFGESHFWNKVQHMLIVYYEYLAKTPVPPAEYASFPIRGYEFHSFNNDDVETLRRDWQYVHDLCKNIVLRHPGNRDKAWRESVKQDYIDTHGTLRSFLSYIELVPKFPPRFRLKKTLVNTIVANHFGYELEQLPGKYITVSDIDKKCLELTSKYKGYTIKELADLFNMPILSSQGSESKQIAEQIIVKMFGGQSKKINQIGLFQRFGLVAKSIVVTSKGGRTEDMKLSHIDFDEIAKTEFIEENGETRPFEFEDSELFEYFSGNEFLCIIFKEPAKEYVIENGKRIEKKHPLSMNKFLGFQRLVFSDNFINTTVRSCWDDTRNKILNNTLKDIIKRDRNGQPVKLKNGEISSAPNFIKSSQNTVFIRGGGQDSSLKNKTETVNGIKMLPQFIWLKGEAIVNELRLKNKAMFEQ